MNEENIDDKSEEPQDDLASAYDEFEDNLKESSEEDPSEVSWDKVEKDVTEFENVEELDEKFDNEGDEEDVPEKKDVKVPRSKTFDENPASVDSIMREALTDNVDLIEITEKDKTAYLKAVLNDQPVILDIQLCNKQFSISIRSRTAWEQTCLYAAVKRDQDSGIVEDLASVIIQLQKYGCALMLKNINEDPFSDLKLDIDEGLEKCVESLKKYKDEKVEALSMPKWGLLLNALRVFESKLSRMGTECLNENFWEPAG
jgi:hypothetical protein